MLEPPLPPDLRIALVHDWLTGMRGGEKVLAELCALFPAAEIFTLLHVPGSVDPGIESHRIHTSFVQRLPGATRHYRWALPLFPAAVESFDLRDYDLVLSSSHCVAKAARPGPGGLAVCYCHTPMRYIWENFDAYFGKEPAPLRWAIGAVAAWLRGWDRRTAGRVRLWLANSHTVRDRIVRCYGVGEQDISVIHPPVDTDVFAAAPAADPPAGLASRSYDLVVSALVPYKRIDLAVVAAKRAGRHLVVVGQGPQRGRLEALAAKAPGAGRIIFAGPVATESLPAYYAHCRAFLFPGLEDFGITPLEATACGRPVLAYRAGGAMDTVVPGLNGLFFTEQSVEALAAALEDSRLDGPWDGEAMVAHAHCFRRERFRRAVSERLAEAWRRHREGEEHV